MKNKKEFINVDLSNYDFRRSNLEGYIFVRCDLSGANFTEANLNNSRFELCVSVKDNPPIFENASFEKSKFSQCKFIKPNFNNSHFINATILNSVFTQGNFIGCRFNNSLIDDLDICNSQLHMCSFINAQIISINYKPYIKIPFLRGYKFFRNSAQIPRTIFINYNEHLEFTEFCHSEARKDKFYTIVKKKNILMKNIALLTIALFGFLTNFGTSFTRWVMCAISIIILFAFFLSLNIVGKPFFWYLKRAAKAFFDVGSTSGLPKFMFLEFILGYFMLGILISLLTIKINLD